TLARRGGDPCPGRSGSPERRRHYYRGAREEGNQEGGPGRGGGRSEFPLYGRRAGLKTTAHRGGRRGRNEKRGRTTEARRPRRKTEKREDSTAEDAGDAEK